MWDDPIVKETRENREALAARFDHDLDKLFTYLKEREKSGGRIIRPVPAKRI